MINNESHFSDNGNGSMGFSTGQYWAMLLWSIDWNVQTMNAFIRVRKGTDKGQSNWGEYPENQFAGFAKPVSELISRQSHVGAK
jgi:hypothetical protein